MKLSGTKVHRVSTKKKRANTKTTYLSLAKSTLRLGHNSMDMHYRYVREVANREAALKASAKVP